MIRTRDFFLYALVLLFVLIGATYTGFSDRAMQQVQSYFSPEPASNDELIAFLDDTDQSTDRDKRIRELQERLRAGDGYLDGAPAVFESVDQVRAAELEQSTSTNLEGERTVTWCSAPLNSPLVAAWPQISALESVEGRRVLLVEETELRTVGTTTEEVRVTSELFYLPARSIRSTFDSCLPDTLIGVTVTGEPLLNESATLFTAVPSTTAIGYTLDGFVVYGPLENDSTLDWCGGHYVNGVYQYHVRVAEPFILGCYAGIPTDVAF